MQFLHRAPGYPVRLGILPGAFNPPTSAHIALAEAALRQVDEVVLTLPCTFPHKSFDGATYEQRCRMLDAVARNHPRLSAATTAGGLFLEIAAEARLAYGSSTGLAILCGRDAAERIIGWPYPDPDTVPRMLQDFQLLVAARKGQYHPPDRLRSRITNLDIPPGFDHLSATEVRHRIRAGVDWEHLIPSSIVPLVREIYLPAR